jgi:hypothetical protein
MAEDQLPPRQASSWGDDPGYDEADLEAGDDGDLNALTSDGHATATGEEDAPAGGEGDQAAPDDVPPATEKQDDSPAEATGVGDAASPEREDGNVAAPGSPPVGAPTDTGSVADAGTGEQPDEASQANQADVPTGQAAQPDDGHANPDTGPEASPQDLQAKYEAILKDLEARYEARMKGLEDEVQALKDRPQAAPDAPGDTGREAGQPRFSDRRVPEDQKNTLAAEHQDDRPGWWSNAKSAVYGAVGSAIATAGVSEVILKSPSGAVEALLTAVPAIVGLLVPVVREGWKRSHDNPAHKP